MIAMVTALGNAGFVARTIKTSDNPETWAIRSNSSAFDVDATTVKNFATNQGVTGFVAEVEYR